MKTAKIGKLLRSEKGFTLIELIVVVIIIGVLAALVVPRFAGKTDEAKINGAMSDLKQMKTVIDMYYAENGEYPAAISDQQTEGKPELIADVLNDEGIAWGNINDPWGNSYTYTVNDDLDSYYIYSNGPDDSSDDDCIMASDSNAPLRDQAKGSEADDDFDDFTSTASSS